MDFNYVLLIITIAEGLQIFLLSACRTPTLKTHIILGEVCHRILKQNHFAWAREVYLLNHFLIRGWSKALVLTLVGLWQVEGQPEHSPSLTSRDKIFKACTSRCSIKEFAESLVLLTVLNQLWKCVVFVTLHSPNATMMLF